MDLFSTFSSGVTLHIITSIFLALGTHQNHPVFLINPCSLDFIQNMEYKFVELMSCAFERSPEEITQQHISFRYNSIKQKLAMTQAKLFEINNLVKTKNPSLLLQPQKNSGGGGGSTSKNGHGHGHGALDISAISHFSGDSRRR